MDFGEKLAEFIGVNSYWAARLDPPPTHTLFD